MLNSVEHEILNTHKYKIIKKFGFFRLSASVSEGFPSYSDKPRMPLFQLINVKMPTVVGILTFISRKISCSVELSMKKAI